MVRLRPTLRVSRRRFAMSIEKTSSGVPEIDPKRRTTKVNFGIIAGIVLFLVIAAGVMVWFSAHAP